MSSTICATEREGKYPKTICALTLLFLNMLWYEVSHNLIHIRRKPNYYSLSNSLLCNFYMGKYCKLPIFSVVASIHFTVPFKHWLEKKRKMFCTHHVKKDYTIQFNLNNRN